MTFKEQMEADLDVFMNPDEFGVNAILTVNGSDREIVVIPDKLPDAETGLFTDVITAKLSDIEGIGVGDVFTIDGKEYRTVVQKPLFEDDIVAVLRVES